MTGNQMKYLLAFVRQPNQQQNQTNIAKIFGVNKSTIHRTITEACKQGILADMGDCMKLTGYGTEFIQFYEKQQKDIIAWMIQQGISEEIALSDSFTLLEGCSPSTINLLCTRGKFASLLRTLKEKKAPISLSGKKIEAYMDKGEYPLAFVFYKLNNSLTTHNKLCPTPKVSMANEAFEHPATLNILKSDSYICLNTKDMTQKSKLNHESLRGHLKRMNYKIGNREKTVMLDNGKVYIPLDILNFVYIKEDNLLEGYMEFTMSCTVGKIHMPESQALFMVHFE